MSKREIGLNVGDRVGDDFEIIEVIPHATCSGTWSVAGRRPDGTLATRTASRKALDALAVLSEGIGSFTEVVDALTAAARGKTMIFLT